MRGGGISRFSVKNILSHSAEDFCTETFYCFTTFGCRESLDKGGVGEYQDFLSEYFFLTVPRNFVGRPYNVSLLSGAEKVWIRGRGSIKVFCRKFSVSQCRKNA